MCCRFESKFKKYLGICKYMTGMVQQRPNTVAWFAVQVIAVHVITQLCNVNRFLRTC